ncbi:MAG: ester cyclase [Acidimicrobiia bacterium]
MSLNRDRLQQSVAAWNAGDLHGYLELYDPAVRLHGYSDRPLGFDEVRGFYEGLWSAVGAPRIDVHALDEAGDTLWCRATMTGTHAGEMMGVPATGRPIAQPVMTSLRFVDGRCVERHSVADMLAVMFQIGALGPPE